MGYREAMRGRLTRLLRLWFACLAVFAAAAAPVQAARAQERPAVVSMLRVERQAPAHVARARVAEAVVPTEPTLEPRVTPLIPRGRLYLQHCALLR